MAEYNSASFGKTDRIHDTDEMRKDCYNRNNKRNNDLYSVITINNLVVKKDLFSNDILAKTASSKESPEDAIIEGLDEHYQMQEALKKASST